MNKPEVKEWVDASLSQCPRANRHILEFIGNVRYSSGKEHVDVIESLYKDAYCLHFAETLNSMFRSGAVKWVLPMNHIVFEYDRIAYDITGVVTDGVQHPLGMMGRLLEGFRHRGRDDELRVEMQACAKDLGVSYEELVELICNEVSRESIKLVLKIEPSQMSKELLAQFYFDSYVEWLL